MKFKIEEENNETIKAVSLQQTTDGNVSILVDGESVAFLCRQDKSINLIAKSLNHQGLNLAENRGSE